MTKGRAQYINSVHKCSLSSIVPLQYVLLMLTGLKERSVFKTYVYCSGGFRGVLWVLKRSPLKCISPWPVAYVAMLRNKGNVYSLFGDTDLAQHTIVLQTCFSNLCKSVLFNASRCLD